MWSITHRHECTVDGPKLQKSLVPLLATTYMLPFWSERFPVRFERAPSKRTPAHGLSILGATVHKVEKSKVSEFAQIHTSYNLYWNIPQKISANSIKGF